MFSGIIKEIGTVEKLESNNEILNLTISSNLKNISLGDSISVDGCCLTVTQDYRQTGLQANRTIDPQVLKSSSPQILTPFTVQITQESLLKTNLSNLKIGSKVNLEPSLKVGDSLDGHLVSGHIDNTGEVCEIQDDGENRIVKIIFPKELRSFIAPKGSVSVNGVSLTVIDVVNDTFSFTLIPYTKNNTNLGLIKIGDLVNLEVDLISRYLVNYMESNKGLVYN